VAEHGRYFVARFEKFARARKDYGMQGSAPFPERAIRCLYQLAYMLQISSRQHGFFAGP
jgi:hypothetical protein